MKKKFGRLFSLYTNSMFFILLIALLFLVLETVGIESLSQGAVGGAYTASSLPTATINFGQVLAIGMTGMFVVLAFFTIQARNENTVISKAGS